MKISAVLHESLVMFFIPIESHRSINSHSQICPTFPANQFFIFNAMKLQQQPTASCLPSYADQPTNGLSFEGHVMSRCICNQICFSNICTKWSRHWQRVSFWCLLWSFLSDLIWRQLMTSDRFNPETFQGFESGKTQSWQSVWFCSIWGKDIFD